MASNTEAAHSMLGLSVGGRPAAWYGAAVLYYIKKPLEQMSQRVKCTPTGCSSTECKK